MERSRGPRSDARPGQSGRSANAGGAVGEPRLLAGYEARALAVDLVDAVLTRRRSLDDALDASNGTTLSARDRALARLIATTVLRRHGRLETVITSFIDKPLPRGRGRLTPILLTAAAQLLFLATPPHAAINVAVEQCRHDKAASRFAKLANAVLRRVANEGPAILATLDDVSLDVPAWMLDRWQACYGAKTARAVAAASLEEAALDLTLKHGLADPPATWAERLGGVLLDTGSVRLVPECAIPELPGFQEGAWWVQDAAANLPHRLLGDVRGKRILDLCAAPGGKTAALAAAGARVTAVDIAPARLARVGENLARLGLAAELIFADAGVYSTTQPFDGVLLDAPCTATGTLRRHPDILHLRRSGDVPKLAAIQARLLERAAALVAPGGTLVYCTCSLEPEEGLGQIASFLETEAGRHFRRRRVEAPEIGGQSEWISTEGDLRTLPHLLTGTSPRLSGLDGFFAARLDRAT